MKFRTLAAALTASTLAACAAPTAAVPTPGGNGMALIAETVTAEGASWTLDALRLPGGATEGAQVTLTVDAPTGTTVDLQDVVMVAVGGSVYRPENVDDEPLTVAAGETATIDLTFDVPQDLAAYSLRVGELRFDLAG